MGLWLSSVAYADNSIESNTYREINANLIQRFQSNGTDPADVYHVIQRMKSSDLERRDPALTDTQIEYGPGHWVYEWSALGEAALKEAEKALSDQETDLARALYLEAAQHFNVAKFPYVRDRDYEHYQMAYESARAAYEAAGELFPTPLEIIDVEFRGASLEAYLHLPDDLTSPAPLVVGSGGVDVFATELPSIAAEFNAIGIAFLNIELPGVGHSNVLTSTPDHEHIYLAALAAVEGDPRLDFERLGGFATSWGGNAMARLALTAGARFDAIVSACGPVHEALDINPDLVRENPGALDQDIPTVQLDIVADRVGIALPRNAERDLELVEKLAGFSLVNQGLLNGDVYSDAPALLIINDNNDHVAPAEDMLSLASQVIGSTTIFTGDNGHCGTRAPITNQSVQFIARHLN